MYVCVCVGGLSRGRVLWSSDMPRVSCVEEGRREHLVSSQEEEMMQGWGVQHRGGVDIFGLSHLLPIHSTGGSMDVKLISPSA